MQNTVITLGQFEVESSIIKIIDPFNNSHEENPVENIINNVKDGVWNAEVNMIENLGNANITLYHEDHKVNTEQFNIEGYIETVTGYLACVDYNQIKNIEEQEELNKKMEELEASIMNMGVASKTGLKAGSYQVQTILEDDKVIAIRLIFIELDKEDVPTEEELAEVV